MTKEYLKMADVFAGSVSPKRIDDGCATEIASGDCAGNYYVLQDDEYWMLIDKEQAEYAAHAINSHDELVAEVERLRESLKHANANYELFERQYYLEKDAHEQLQADVAELRHEISMVSNVLDEVDRVVTERIKNGAYDLDDIADEVSLAIERINRDVD